MISHPNPNNVLAKDRHYIQRLKREVERLDDNVSKKARLKEVIDRSQRAVQARIDSIPSDLAQRLNPDLPVSAEADTIIDAIKAHQVIIVAGETGSGKTTQLPKLALLAGRGITGQIGHTQPRRLAARSVASRIADELGEPLGKTVSFKVRFTEEGGSHSLIKLMTDGILLAELAKDRYLTRYDTIIIDEAHERSLNIDFIMGYLKRLLPKRPDLKVIITSATLDTDRFAEYFAINGKKAPVFNVQGRSYPVEVRYRPLTDEIVSSSDDDAFDDIEDNLPRALVAAVQECFDDAKQKGRQSVSDILIFAATEAQIRELAEVLTTYAPPHTEVLTLFARQSFAEQARIFSPSAGRRVIISTNVAETALTVPNIGYVIDLGFARISRYNYRSRVQRLPIEAVSQAAANQRKGRCGRVSEGVCIRLYSEADFNSRPEFTEPEILRTNLASVILQMAYLGLGDIHEFDFITAPDYRLVNDGKKLLYELHAIDDTPTKTALKKRKKTPSVLTDIGKKMAKMPIDPRLSRMLIAAQEFDCMADMLIIVSALAVQDIKERPFEKQTTADQKHALFRTDDSDFLFYVTAFRTLFDKHELNGNQLLSANGRKSFAKKHFFSYPRVREWQKTHSQLSQMMTDLGFDSQKTPSIFDDVTQKIPTKTAHKPSKSTIKQTAEPTLVHYANIHRTLLTGLLSFVAKKTQTKGEYLMAKNQKVRIFPASTLHKKGAEWVMAFEVVETSNVYMRCLARVQPEWILSAADKLLKYHYFEPHWSKKTGRVRAYAQISLFGLIVVEKQLVNYEKIDLEESREIFIKDAIIANNYGIETAFLTHNQAKIDEVMLNEEKLRRRDLLVDEQMLYEFYNQKIPSHIASRKAFQDYLGELEKVNPTALYFKDSDVVSQNVNAGQEFPTSLKVGALTLPLSYVFDPSCDDDGVSVKVPKQALSQLDSVALLWGILGWRYELVVQLLKSLPKDIRKKIVPIPATADKIFDKLDEQKPMGFLDQLSQALNQLGVKVSSGDFVLSATDKYLQPLICVVNDKGQIIDKDRDLIKLQLKYQSQTNLAAKTVQGAHQTFPIHFKFSQYKKVSGINLKEFSALVKDDTEDFVHIAHYTDLLSAMTAHKQGVLTLVKLKLGAKQKQLAGQIDKAFKLAFAPLGTLEALKSIVIDATLQLTFDKYALCFLDDNFLDDNQNSKENSLRWQILNQKLLTQSYDIKLLKKLPLSFDEYDKTEQLILENFLSVGQEVLKLFKEVYTTWQAIRGQLLMLDTDVFGDNIQDIEDQLDDLSLGDFIYKVDSSIWQNYLRYLSALKIRLDRLPHNLKADSEGVYALDTHMERLANRVHDKKYSEYRWLLEEYRINLFAQPMKTIAPVSDKRLDRLWAKITTT